MDFVWIVNVIGRWGGWSGVCIYSFRRFLFFCLFLFSSSKPRSHRRSQEATGGHRRPQDATGGHRMPQEATGSHSRPQDATEGPRRPQEASRKGSPTRKLQNEDFFKRMFKENTYFLRWLASQSVPRAPPGNKETTSFALSFKYTTREDRHCTNAKRREKWKSHFLVF